MTLENIHRAKVRAAEDTAIAGIPNEMLGRLKLSNAELKAKGGCPGCGSNLVGVHKAGCKGSA